MDRLQMADDTVLSGQVQLVTVGENHDGQRLDNFLLGRLKGVPRTWVYRVLRKGEVRVNKGRSKPAYRLKAGDVVRIPPVRRVEKIGGPPAQGLISRMHGSVLYEDDAILVVNKPSGLAVHGGSGVSHGVIEALRAARPDAPFLELVHRLDRDTSGCLMLAKRRSSLTALQELQRNGKIEKRYLALLHGRIRAGSWRTDLPLRKNTLKSGERVVTVDPEGKAAATRFRVLRRFAEASLVEAVLETGRTHQIRVHAAANGTPILGDLKYGDAGANRKFRDLGLRRLFLHAASLRMPWPKESGCLVVEAPLAHELEVLVETLDDKELRTDRV
jgi:23S rRNA pseudouridine955/2504/2580 synthase